MWGGDGVGWGLHSHYIVKPNLVLRLGWGFDNRFVKNRVGGRVVNLNLENVFKYTVFFLEITP